MTRPVERRQGKHRGSLRRHLMREMGCLPSIRFPSPHIRAAHFRVRQPGRALQSATAEYGEGGNRLTENRYQLHSQARRGLIQAHQGV